MWKVGEWHWLLSLGILKILKHTVSPFSCLQLILLFLIVHPCMFTKKLMVSNNSATPTDPLSVVPNRLWADTVS